MRVLWVQRRGVARDMEEDQPNLVQDLRGALQKVCALSWAHAHIVELMRIILSCAHCSVRISDEHVLCAQGITSFGASITRYSLEAVDFAGLDFKQSLERVQGADVLVGIVSVVLFAREHTPRTCESWDSHHRKMSFYYII